MPSRETSGPAQPGWFPLVWMMAFAVHYIDLAPRHSHLVVLGLAAVPALLARESSLPFLVFVAISTLFALFDLPSPANHLVLALLVNAALLGAAASARGRRRPGNEGSVPNARGAQWLEAARAPVTWTLVTVYAFAVFHKLNWSFFDPAVSCAGEIASRAVAITGVTAPIPSAAVSGLAAATLVIEALIPLLLVTPSWRFAGIAIGAAFHAVLAAAGFADFATFACATYVLLAADVVPRIPDAERHRRRAMLAWGTYLGLAALDALFVGGAGRHLPGRDQLLFVSWLTGMAILMTPLVKTMWRHRPPTEPALWRMQSAWYALIPLLALLNGMAPYLGFRTTSTFSMFSNLRVEEGRSNHLVPALTSLEMTSWMRDTVDVLAFELTSAPGLNVLGRLQGGHVALWNGSRWIDSDGTAPVRVPWIELKRTVVRWRDAGVTGLSIRYRHNGVTSVATDAVHDAGLTAPLPWWVRWFVAFRDIETESAVRCRW